MISVLTLTYKRHLLLEEAINSFLLQDCDDCEMVIINDNSKVDYVFNHPNIKIINHKERFSSISAKIEWGYKQCKYDYIYRLDDDDLLAPNAINIIKSKLNNGSYDIYRSLSHYLLDNNEYMGQRSTINTGNVYSKSYLEKIEFPKNSIGEDIEITFNQNAKIFNFETPTMIYRWGMETFHISGKGERPNDIVLSEADAALINEEGVIELYPKFNQDYYSKIDFITDKVKKQFFEISNILNKIGERVEGNLVCDITSENIIAETNRSKILNLITLSLTSKKICEIGVNAGHSLLLMISSNPYAEYLIFDLGQHSYTRPCINYIKKEYPSTKITEIYGDTKLTLQNSIPKEFKNNIDLVHVDGGHDTHTVVSDFIYTQNLLNSQGIVVFDDYNYGNIKEVIDYYQDQKLISRINQKRLIDTDLHYVYKFNN